MKRNNIWNNLFHKDKVLEIKNKVREKELMIARTPAILEEIDRAVDLFDFLRVHKYIYSIGFKNKNLKAGCVYHSESIDKMIPSEVYLSNELCFSIINWEKYKDKHPNEYSVVFTQYDNLLRTNVKLLNVQANNFVKNAKKLNY